MVKKKEKSVVMRERKTHEVRIGKIEAARINE